MVPVPPSTAASHHAAVSELDSAGSSETGSRGISGLDQLVEVSLVSNSDAAVAGGGSASAQAAATVQHLEVSPAVSPSLAKPTASSSQSSNLLFIEIKSLEQTIALQMRKERLQDASVTAWRLMHFYSLLTPIDKEAVVYWCALATALGHPLGEKKLCELLEQKWLQEVCADSNVKQICEAALWAIEQIGKSEIFFTHSKAVDALKDLIENEDVNDLSRALCEQGADVRFPIYLADKKLYQFLKNRKGIAVESLLVLSLIAARTIVDILESQTRLVSNYLLIEPYKRIQHIVNIFVSSVVDTNMQEYLQNLDPLEQGYIYFSFAISEHPTIEKRGLERLAALKACISLQKLVQLTRKESVRHQACCSLGEIVEEVTQTDPTLGKEIATQTLIAQVLSKNPQLQADAIEILKLTNQKEILTSLARINLNFVIQNQILLALQSIAMRSESESVNSICVHEGIEESVKELAKIAIATDQAELDTVD